MCGDSGNDHRYRSRRVAQRCLLIVIATDMSHIDKAAQQKSSRHNELQQPVQPVLISTSNQAELSIGT